VYDIILTTDEVKALAGGYKRPCDQLAELHRRGFHRARISKLTNEVVLERAHYHAVSAGMQPEAEAAGPMLRSKRLRMVHGQRA